MPCANRWTPTWPGPRLPRWSVPCLATALVIALSSVPLPADAGPAGQTSAPIVNGVLTADFPAVGIMGSTLVRQPICTVTLIGCRTVLTAAHCFCEDPRLPCPETSENDFVFLPHGGFYDIESFEAHPGFAFGVQHDLAIARLDRPVTGIPPARINEVGPVPHGTDGVIVGFGTTGGRDDYGLKRRGTVTTTACQAVPESRHICWTFDEPVGPPGTDANTCLGDSGGPLFVDTVAGTVLAGVTSGGTNAGCSTPDHPWEADVVEGRQWIRSATGPDLDATTCGDLPRIGDPATSTHTATGLLDTTDPADSHTLQVLPGTRLLRVTLNGEFQRTPLQSENDFELRLVSPNGTVCHGEGLKPFKWCEIPDPEPGPWKIEAHLAAGTRARYQLTTVTFAAPGSIRSCTPGPQVACIDDHPGDHRFRVTVDFATSQGNGTSGRARALDLSAVEVDTGTLFTFFNPANPEMLLKILNGCPVNGHHWILYAATTNVGFEVVVTDTKTGRVWRQGNQDRSAAGPVQDTSAFPCSWSE